ncbi:hypothetical protein Pcinc_038843, partial [Petrolisthes cinctipes]
VGAVTLPEEGDLGPDADLADPTTGLTLRHRTAMTRTWDLVRPDLKVHGVNFFLRLFREHPQIQTRFRGFDGKSEAELKTSKRLVAHATTVMMAITSLVDNIDDPSVLVELLTTTGQNHHNRGVQKNDFILLAPVLIAFLRDNLGGHWSCVAEEAWTKALKVINTVIFSAYENPI